MGARASGCGRRTNCFGLISLQLLEFSLFMKREGKEEEKTKKKMKARFVSLQDKSRLGKTLTLPINVFLVGLRLVLILFHFGFEIVR